MISFLEKIAGIIIHLPEYILYAVESLINLFMEGIEGLLLAAVAILPPLPEVISPPSFIEDINWFYPVGAVISIVLPLLTAYVIFLGVRWIFSKLGEL